MALAFDFVGGSSQDPVDRRGLTNVLVGLFNEGPAGLDSTAYQARLKELAVKMGFEFDRDSLWGVMLAPTAEPGLSPFGPSLIDELRDPRFRRSLGIFADDAVIAAFGRNPLDPRCRPAAAAAGREQGRRRAEEVADFMAGAAG